MSIHALSRSTNSGFAAPVIDSAIHIVFWFCLRFSC
jgi:hypothetical protein